MGVHGERRVPAHKGFGGDPTGFRGEGEPTEAEKLSTFVRPM